MVLYSFGFAAFPLNALPPDVAQPKIRRAFPPFYLSAMGIPRGAAALLWPAHPFGAGLMALIAVTTLPARHVLMPAINHAKDAGWSARGCPLFGKVVLDFSAGSAIRCVSGL